MYMVLGLCVVLLVETSQLQCSISVVGCFLYWGEAKESADGVSLSRHKALSVLAVRGKSLVCAAPSLSLPIHMILCPLLVTQFALD